MLLKMCGILRPIAYFSIVSLSIIECRKYDIEAESQKLYGEDLKGALKKFRKTYDYAQILTDRSENIGSDLLDSYSYLEDYYAPRIEKKISELLGLKEDGTRKEALKKHLRQNEEDKEGHSTISDVQLLDGYIAKKRVLTVPEINSFANVGFEFAGKIIHGILANMGSEGNGESRSTKLPYADDDKDETVRTVHDHSVTNEGTFISTVKPDIPEPDDDVALYRARTSQSDQ